jgi:hypothetical protein
MIKLTETRQITPYKWVHPSEEWSEISERRSCRIALKADFSKNT